MNSPIHILLVDDDMFIVDALITDVDWNDLGAKPFRAISSKDAKKVLEENQINIMVCDIEMPGESGIRLFEWVRGSRPDIECIFLTSHSNFEYAQRALQLKSFDYVLKPVSGEELQVILKKAIDHVMETRNKEKLMHYGNLIDGHLAAVKNQDTGTNPEDMVADTMKYIAQNISDDLSIQNLSKRLFISSNYLMRIFKKTTGVSVMDYIIEQRLSLASKMLKETNITASQIASMVGYHSYSHFSTEFKKVYKMGPVKFRKQHQ